MPAVKAIQSPRDAVILVRDLNASREASFEERKHPCSDCCAAAGVFDTVFSQDGKEDQEEAYCADRKRSPKDSD
jgi:hypothetical protein